MNEAEIPQRGAEVGAILRPLAEMGRERLRRVQFVLTDIDDTLTDDGRMSAAAYSALERLHHAGIAVIPVTGRPAGWCDLIVRFWPVSAVIGENGAFYFAPGKQGGVERVFSQTDEKRRKNRKKLNDLARTILDEVEDARVSADQTFREADLAIDIAEDGRPLARESVDRIVACFESAGAMAKVSSIHVNGWFGQYDKLTMARRLFQERYDLDLSETGDRVLFVGDSPNDAPMFGFFENSVGVANFSAFRDQVATPPKYITRAPGGRGFSEVAEAVLEARNF